MNNMSFSPKIKFLNEPYLTFGYGQKAIDPRDGLTLFGPFDYKKVKGAKTIGIVGSPALIELYKSYLHKISQPVTNSDSARPNFPGLDAAFGISVNFDNIIELPIPEAKLKEYCYYTDGYQRIHNWANLFVDSITRHLDEDENDVQLWFIVIPEYIYKFGRPQSRIPASPNNNSIGLKGKDRYTQEQLLFFQEEREALQEAYKYEMNFHNQLKAKLLESRIVTQIIRESKITIPKEDDLNAKKLETAMAWNIATTMYYKLGGLPWKMGDIRDKVCYLGLVYKKTEELSESNNACCAAQMFLDSGDGMVFRGNVGPWWNPTTKEFHLRKEDAKKMITQSLEAFKAKFDYYPEEVFIHARTFFNDEEWEGFSEAAEGKSRIVGVRIRELNGFKLFRGESYCIPRGMMMIRDEMKAYLWTKGFIPRFKSQLGLEVPSPLDISIVRGEANIETICRDILSLSKLNYNTCNYGDGLPVTLKFADSIGEILTAGRDLRSGVLPFKHYI